MKKIFLICILLFGLVGCSSGNYDSYENNNITGVSSERIIIYSVNMRVTVANVDDSINEIIAFSNDMWIEEKTQSSNYAYLIIRINTNLLEEFTEEVKSLGEVSSYSLTSTDITNSYYDIESEKQLLQDEYDVLEALKSTSTAEEIVNIIAPRQAVLKQQIFELNKELTNLDTSINYSYFNLSISTESQSSSFGKKIIDSFINGGTVILMFLQYGFLVIVFLTPLALIAVPSIVIIRKRKNKKSKKEIDHDE